MKLARLALGAFLLHVFQRPAEQLLLFTPSAPAHRPMERQVERDQTGEDESELLDEDPPSDRHELAPHRSRVQVEQLNLEIIDEEPLAGGDFLEDEEGADHGQRDAVPDHLSERLPGHPGGDERAIEHQGNEQRDRGFLDQHHV